MLFDGSGYGKPPPGSKSEARAKKYNENCAREVIELCGLIQEKGEGGRDGRYLDDLLCQDSRIKREGGPYCLEISSIFTGKGSIMSGGFAGCSSVSMRLEGCQKETVGLSI